MTEDGSAERWCGCCCEQAPLGTGGALTIARPVLIERFLLMNGDAMFDINLRALEQAARQRRALATLALRTVVDVSRYGRVIEADGRSHAVPGERPRPPGAGTINGGIYVLNRSLLDLVERLPCSIEQDVFPLLVQRGDIRGQVLRRLFSRRRHTGSSGAGTSGIAGPAGAAGRVF